MTITVNPETDWLAQNYARRAGRWAPEHEAAVNEPGPEGEALRAWIDGVVETGLLREYTSSGLHGLIEPHRQGTSTVVIIEAPMPTTAPVPVSTSVDTKPTPAPPRPQPVAVEEPLAAGSATPWAERFTAVHVDAVKRLNPDQLAVLTTLRRRMDGLHETTIDPAEVCTLHGITRDNLRRLLTRPAGHPRGTLAPDAVLKKEWLHPDGSVRWIVTVRKINLTPGPVGSDGEPTQALAGAGDRFIRVFHGWLYLTPSALGLDADLWAPRPDPDGRLTAAVWAASMIQAEGAGKPSTSQSVASLARMWDVSVRTIRDRLAAAEDAGLVTVSGNRRGLGGETPSRRWHEVPTMSRTSESRRINERFAPVGWAPTEYVDPGPPPF